MDKLSALEIERLLQSSDEAIVADTLLYITFNLDDARWIQDKCLDLINEDSRNSMKGLAITCLGHLARIHGTTDRKAVIPVLNRCKKKQRS